MTQSGLIFQTPSGLGNPNNIGIIKPTSVQPEYAHYFGSEASQLQLAYNQAYGGLQSGSVVGTPTIDTYDAQFVGTSSGVSTGVTAGETEPLAMTIIVAAKYPGWVSGSSPGALLVGNGVPMIQDNILLYINGSGGGINALISDVGASVEPVLAFPTSGPGIATNWFLCSLLFALGNTVTITNHSAGTSTTGGVSAPTSFGTNNPLFLGTMPRSTIAGYTGTINMAYAAIWNSELSSADLALEVASVRSYLAARGISV